MELLPHQAEFGDRSIEADLVNGVDLPGSAMEEGDVLRPIEEPGPARKPDRTDGENDDGGEGQGRTGPRSRGALRRCALGLLLSVAAEAGDEELALPLGDLRSVLAPGLELGESRAGQQVVGVAPEASHSSAAAENVS